MGVLAGVGLTGCARAPGEGAPGGERVVLVEVAPLVSLVEPLVGEGVEVRSIVPAGRSPHGYQMTPGEARALSEASMVVMVGPVLEPAVTRAVDRRATRDRVVTVAALVGVAVDDHDDAHEHGHHDHDDHHDHDHGPVDPHLWLDPVLMAAFVGAAPDELARRGLGAPDAAARAATLRDQVLAVDAAYRERLKPFAGRAIITHHDAFRRLAERYGLSIARVVRPVAAVEPTPGDLAKVREAVETHGVGAIFVEPQFPDALPRRIAERLGLGVRTLDPEGSTDWEAMMRANLDELVAGLSEPPPAGDDGSVESQPQTRSPSSEPGGAGLEGEG